MYKALKLVCTLGDLKTRKSPGTSKLVIKHNLLRFQISGGLIMNMITKFQEVS